MILAKLIDFPEPEQQNIIDTRMGIYVPLRAIVRIECYTDELNKR